MSAEGRWTITMKTPLGSQAADVVFAVNGNGLTGSLSSKLGSAEITGGRADGNSLTWSSQLTFPRPLKAEFSAMIDGDKMTGTVILGQHGKAPFSGVRV